MLSALSFQGRSAWSAFARRSPKGSTLARFPNAATSRQGIAASLLLPRLRNQGSASFRQRIVASSKSPNAMAAQEDEQIKQVVLDFLKTADMAVVTERTVLKHVQDTLQLERPVAEYKPLVSNTIDEFLATLDDDGDGADGGGEEDDPSPPTAAAATKRGRKRGGDGEEGATKKRRGGGSGGEELLFSRDLSSRRKARVRRWEGKLYVDVREFYEAEGGEAPTQKGLSMDPGQWGRLARELPRLLAAQRAGDEAAPPVQLSTTRLASISSFRGTSYLGLREFYEKDGQLAPTKKGVNLGLAEAEALLAAAPNISAAAGINTAAEPQEPQEPPPPPAATATAAAPRTSAAAAAAPAAVKQPPVAGGSAAAAPSAGSGGSGAGAGAAAPAAEVVELGAHKRLSLSRFGGRLSVDLREFYEDNGQILPGKKGISLPTADWSVLCSHLREVCDALNRKDMNYCLQLSGMRRVSLSSFKGVTYVGVREFYDKGGGELVPGRKGLSMNPQQWAALVAGAPAISAALQQAQG
ncbi:hypothetical protein Agub_g8814 [Astrephomene gubernaculifera]|uniref:DEK-C domain-containing protein n=1 Tax=Astrephomene gubernaculifera TaxID=47775 RepID=A0AAD3DUZ3_9CHLO|nr:hypothetical protein Agub_g8814 [Astrephomene gubernaculifera]